MALSAQPDIDCRQNLTAGLLYRPGIRCTEIIGDETINRGMTGLAGLFTAADAIGYSTHRALAFQ